MGRIGRSGVLACLLAGAGTGWIGSAQAQGRAQAEDVDPEARQRFHLANTLYGQGRFVEAAQEFERVYELTRNAVLLHNVYVAYRDAGDPRRAAEFLRRYLDGADEIEDRAVMEGRLATLERQVAEEHRQGRALAEAEGRGGEGGAGTGGETGEPSRPAAGQDGGPSVVGPVVVMAAGGALIVAGGVAGLLAMQRHGSLEDDCGTALVCPATEQPDVDALGTTALVADVLLGAGLVTATAGLIWLLLQPDAEGGTAGLGLACDGRGCLASYRGALP